MSSVSNSTQVRFNYFLKYHAEFFSRKMNHSATSIDRFIAVVNENILRVKTQNVSCLAECLDKIRSLKPISENPKGALAAKVDTLTKAVINKTLQDNFRYIHLLAYQGDFSGVVSLVHLDPNLISKKSSQNKTALDYAIMDKSKNARSPTVDYLKMCDKVSKFKIDCLGRIDDIHCTKGNPLPSLSLNESLLIEMSKTNLAINHSYSAGGVNYYFTDSFTTKHSRFKNRPLLFCLIEKSNKLYPRLYWLSRSQGLWRNIEKSFENWIGKTSRGEESLSLPFMVNLIADKIHYQSTSSKLEADIAEQLFKYVIGWSALEVDASFDFHGFSMIEQRRGDKTTYSPMEATTSDGDESYALNYVGPQTLPKDPSKNKLGTISPPNFSSGYSEHKIHRCGLYKNVTAYVFPSMDNNIRYIFICVKGCTFLAKAEYINSPVNKHGLNANCIELGSLALPLLEYRHQFHDQFLEERDKVSIEKWQNQNPGKIFKGYVSTWKYLKDTPIIKEFYEKAGMTPPEKFANLPHD